MLFEADKLAFRRPEAAGQSDPSLMQGDIVQFGSCSAKPIDLPSVERIETGPGTVGRINPVSRARIGTRTNLIDYGSMTESARRYCSGE